MAEQFFDPRRPGESTAHVVELGAILLEIICDDMKRLEGMRDKAGDLLLEGHRSATAKASAAPAAAGSGWVAPSHLKTAEDLRRYASELRGGVPRFESAEEVRRAHDLLRAEQAREAELTIPLDAAGRLCPADPPVHPI